MLIGTAIVAFFSDPMVDVITELGVYLSIPVFYISFVITPFCSNASELIASIVFAAKKTVTSSSMTYSQLYGATTMNNHSRFGHFLCHNLLQRPRLGIFCGDHGDFDHHVDSLYFWLHQNNNRVVLGIS